MTNLRGFKMLLLGMPGAGKSYALRTLPYGGAVLFTEASHATLSDMPSSSFAWHTIIDRADTFKALSTLADKVTKSSMEELRKWRDPNRRQQTMFTEMLGCLSNFVDERTGQNLGPVDDWPEHMVLAIDSLTPINSMIAKSVTGGRIMREQSEWGVMVELQRQFIEALTSLKCCVIVNGHLSMERDADGSVYMLSPVAITRNYSTELPRYFDEVVLAEKVGSKFIWNTATTRVMTKTRFLPTSDNLAPNYGQMFEAWHDKGGVLPEGKSE